MMNTRFLALLVALLSPSVAFADVVPENQRTAILRRAQVLFAPAQPIEQADLRHNAPGPGAFSDDDVVSCRFEARAVGGKTPKFDCRIGPGDVVRVRYRDDNPEVYTQVAASRLMSALGFPADRIYVVAAVRCAGCPPDPFEALQCLNHRTAASCFPRIDYEEVREFKTVVLERPLKGRRVNSREHEAWAWPELRLVDHAAGGASRAEIDALRLMAVFLADWDTKAGNHRLVCSESRDEAQCRSPLAMIKDLGATFGPYKIDLDGWARAPVWTNAQQCTVSMHALPYEGKTFGEANISEAGRLLLADRLRRLSAAQIDDLFTGARFADFAAKNPAAKTTANWVTVFRDKVKAIADRPSCPE